MISELQKDIVNLGNQGSASLHIGLAELVQITHTVDAVYEI
jgi:hypothetical protein